MKKILSISLLIFLVTIIPQTSFSMDSGLRNTTSGKVNFGLSEVFIASAVGAAAGALIGLSSLAFFKEPSDRLNNIPMGASIGLYAGLAFGLYFALDSSDVFNFNFDNTRSSTSHPDIKFQSTSEESRVLLTFDQTF